MSRYFVLLPKPFVAVRLVRGRGSISSSLVVIEEVEVLIGRVVVIVVVST